MDRAGSAENVWFIGPWEGPGFYLRVSDAPGRSTREHGGSPPDFPWKSMDRKWSASYKSQGTTAMDYGDGWSVLSVANYTVDSQPNMLVAFAVQRADVTEAEMRALAESSYPSVWERLGTKAEATDANDDRAVCPGSDKYVSVDADKVGENHAACPICGRRTAFHRITGRFRRHHRGDVSGSPRFPGKTSLTDVPASGYDQPHRAGKG